MGKLPCLDCNEPVEISSDKEIDDNIACDSCGSDFVIVAVEPLEMEWSYEDYFDYEEGDDEDLDDEDDDFEDEWEQDERNAELWEQQFSKRKRVSQVDKELNAAKRGASQPRFHDS